MLLSYIIYAYFHVVPIVLGVRREKIMPFEANQGQDGSNHLFRNICVVGGALMVD